MTKTINIANKLALKKECKYSILLPGNDNLVGFYEKIWYQSFFKTSFLKFTFETLKNISDFENLHNSDGFEKFDCDTSKFNYFNFEKIREKFYNSLYDVFWDANSIKFAILENDFFILRNIFAKNKLVQVLRTVDGLHDRKPDRGKHLAASRG